MTTSAFGFKQVCTKAFILCPNLKFDPEATVNYFLKCYRGIKAERHIQKCIPMSISKKKTKKKE